MRFLIPMIVVLFDCVNFKWVSSFYYLLKKKKKEIYVSF